MTMVVRRIDRRMPSRSCVLLSVCAPHSKKHDKVSGDDRRRACASRSGAARDSAAAMFRADSGGNPGDWDACELVDLSHDSWCSGTITRRDDHAAAGSSLTLGSDPGVSSDPEG